MMKRELDDGTFLKVTCLKRCTNETCTCKTCIRNCFFFSFRLPEQSEQNAILFIKNNNNSLIIPNYNLIHIFKMSILLDFENTTFDYQNSFAVKNVPVSGDK